MALLTVQQPTASGVTLTFDAVAASDVFVNDGDTIAIFDNNSGGNLTVDYTPGATPQGLSFAQITSATIANGAIGAIGPFPPAQFNDANGQVTLTPSTTTSVTVAIVRVK